MIGSIIGGVGAIGAGVGNMIMQSNIGKRIKRNIEAQDRNQKAFFAEQRNQNALQTASGQMALNNALQAMQQGLNNSRGSAAVSGSSAAVQAAQRQAANNTVGNTMATLAAADTQRQQSLANQQLSSQNKIYELQRGNLQRQGEQISQAMGQISSAMSSMGSGIDAAMAKK